MYSDIAVLFEVTSHFRFHEKQITRPAELPRPFFPSHSHVKDFMFGSLQPVIKLLEDEEIIFAMYYAPWCAESKLVRGEFISAAKVLSNTVHFYSPLTQLTSISVNKFIFLIFIAVYALYNYMELTTVFFIYRYLSGHLFINAGRQDCSCRMQVFNITSKLYQLFILSANCISV